MPLDPDLTEFSTASPILVSFDFNDFADGTGVRRFLPCEAIDSAGATYFLTTDEVDSGKITRHTSGNSTTNYDIAFSTPKDIKGTAIINITTGLNPSTGSISITATVTLKHFDGSTETTMGTAKTTTSISSSSKISQRHCLKIPITTQQHFAQGDILRVTIATTTSGTGLRGFGHDPSNRNDDQEVSIDQIITSGDSTNLNVYIPFLLNI